MASSAFRFEMRDDFVAYPKTAEFNEQTYTGEFRRRFNGRLNSNHHARAQTLSYLPELAAREFGGTVLWTALLAVAGYYLESQYEKVADWVSPASMSSSA